MRWVLVSLFLFSLLHVSFAQKGFDDPKSMSFWKKELSLTDDQAAYLTKIETGYKHSLSQIVSDTDQGEDRNTQIKEIAQARDNQIAEILNAEQYQKYLSVLEDKKEQRRQENQQNLRQARKEAQLKKQVEIEEQ